MNNIVIQDVYISKNCIHKNTLITSHYNLFYLQKKIYQASKECHLSLVQSLQKLLVSLSSIKILAYIKVQQTIKKSQVVKNKIDLDKYSELSLDLSVLIKKEIILWCLQPEWQPKIESSRISQELMTSEYDSNHQNNIYSFGTEVSFKNIQKHYILSKLQTIQWIVEAIINCFNKNSFVQVISSQLINLFRSDNLYIFMKWILFNGISWNLFRQTMPKIKKSIDTVVFFEYLKRRIYIYKVEKLKLSAQRILLYLMSDLNFTAQSCRSYKIWNLKHINSKTRIVISKLHFRPSNLYQIYYNEFFYNIRDILFHKDKFGRVRTNTHLSMSIVSYKINNLINQQQGYFMSKIKYNISRQINKQIRKVVYRWARKNCK